MVASRKFLQPINLLNLSDDPASGAQGDFYYNTTRDVLKFYDGSAWVEVGSGTITVGDTAPANPVVGNAWFDNTTGAFYIYDGSFWVEVTGVISGGIFNVEEDTSPTLGGNLDAASYDITNIDNLGFDLTPDNAGGVGELVWNDGDGTLDLGLKGGNINLKIGQQEVALCYNGTGAALSKGTVVYVTGAQGQRPALAKASASSESTSSKTFGVVLESIADGAEGFVLTFGVLRGIDTLAYTEGAALWLSATAGQFTTTMPTPPNHGVFIGYCIRSHASSGEIFVKIQNGYELNELHNILISSAKTDQTILYDEATSLWKNASAYSVTARNASGSTINAFTPIVINTETLGYEQLNFTKADASSAALMPAYGITTASVASDATVRVITFGPIRGLTLTGYTAGDLLYVASGGGFTTVRPTGTNIIQPFAKVLSVDNGSIFVFGNTFWSSIDTLPNLSTGKVWKGDSGRPVEVTLDTDAVTEGSTNLYFTDERAQDAAYQLFQNGTHNGVTIEYNDATNKINVTNDGVRSLSGTSNEIVVTPSSTGAVTVQFDTTVNLPSNTSIGDVSSTEIGYVNGVTSGIQSQLDGKAASSHNHAVSDITSLTEEIQDVAAGMITGATHTNISVDYNDSTGLLAFTASPGYSDEDARDAIAAAIAAGTQSNITFSHDDSLNTFSFGLTNDVTIANNLTVTNDLDVLGNITYANELVISDPLIYIGEGNSANSVDLGFVASFNNGAYQHSGLVRDATDGKWKLFSSVEDEPTTVINFAQAIYDTFVVGKIESTGTTITFNSLTSGAASSNAVLEVERGTDDNVAIRWNEATDAWEYTNDGTTYNEIGSGGGGGGSVQTQTVLSNSWWLGV